MVGLLNGMDNEDRSSVAPDDKKDVSVVQDESSAHMSAEESQESAKENADNEDQVEHVKQIKSILKQRGQYTFRKVKVDFDLIPKKIPYNENDYTVEIQIIEKEPVKIKSWAAIFAAKKAEAEAEAAAIAEAEEALKKAEEVQKREAAKKASKAKLAMQKEEKKESSSKLTEPNEPPIPEQDPVLESTPATVSQSQLTELMVPELNQESTSGRLASEQSEREEPSQDSSCQSESDRSQDSSCQNESHRSQDSSCQNESVRSQDSSGQHELDTSHDSSCQNESDRSQGTEKDQELSSEQATSEQVEQKKQPEEYLLSENIINEVLESLSPGISSSEDTSQETTETDLDSERKDQKGCTHTESSVAEQNAQLQDEHTSNDLDDISTHEEASESQLSYDSELKEASEQQTSSSESQLSGTKSDSTEGLADVTEDSSSKVVHLKGKKVPKKVLVTAASLVEDILADMPTVLQAQLEHEIISKEAIPDLDDDAEEKTKKKPQPDDETKRHNSNSIETTKNKPKDAEMEPNVRRKRREFKKSKDSGIYEHVRKSLENAAPEILETAVDVLDEIEKIVVDKVGSAVL